MNMVCDCVKTGPLLLPPVLFPGGGGGAGAGLGGLALLPTDADKLLSEVDVTAGRPLACTLLVKAPAGQGRGGAGERGREE